MTMYPETPPQAATEATPAEVSPSRAIKQQQGRNMLIIIGILLAIGIPLVLLMYKAEQRSIQQQERRNPSKKVNILGKAVEKEAWQADAAARLRLLEEQNRDLQNEMEKMRAVTQEHERVAKANATGSSMSRTRLQENDGTSGGGPGVTGRGNKRARPDLPDEPAEDMVVPSGPPTPLQQALPRPGANGSNGPASMTPVFGAGKIPSSFSPTQPSGPQMGAPGSTGAPITIGGPSASPGANPPGAGLPTTKSGGGTSGATTPQTNVASPTGSGAIKVTRVTSADSSNKNGKTPASSDPRAEVGKRVAWVPSGTFMKVQLLSGLDAPTNTGASGSPYPVLMRVTDLAELPNLYQMDLTNCFVVGTGYGDISSERAQIRSENMACVRSDGSTLDVGIKGYVTGEDGKLGMRGKLVTRDGAMLARALLSGFATGIAQAFRPVQSQGLFTGQPGQVGFPDPTAVGQSVGLSAAGGAAQILAQHYVRMARKIYPIIEVGSGRTADLVVTKGFELTLKDKDKPSETIGAQASWIGSSPNNR